MPRSLLRLHRCRALRLLAFAGWLLLVLTPILSAPAMAGLPHAAMSTPMSVMADCHAPLPGAPDTDHGQPHATCHCAAMSGSVLATATASAWPDAPPVTTTVRGLVAPALPTLPAQPPLRPPLA